MSAVGQASDGRAEVNLSAEDRRDGPKSLSTPDVWDLTENPDDRRDGAKGLAEPAQTGSTPPPDHARDVALRLLYLFGICLVLIIVVTTATAWLRPSTLGDMIGFFGTVVATLGTLLGGVVAFYFSRN